MLEKGGVMKRIALLVAIGIAISTMAFADPVYTEGESYQIEVLEDGQMQVRKATRVYRDGIEISKTYHRKVLAPGADVTDEPERVIAVSEAVWTEDVKKKYKDKQKKNEIIEEEVVEEPTEEIIAE